MGVDCRSPFVYCRIRWDGQVDLCNRRDWVIGNIDKNTLMEAFGIANRPKSSENKFKKMFWAVDPANYLVLFQSREQDYDDDRSYFAAGIYETGFRFG